MAWKALSSLLDIASGYKIMSLSSWDIRNQALNNLLMMSLNHAAWQLGQGGRLCRTVLGETRSLMVWHAMGSLLLLLGILKLNISCVIFV